MPLDHDALLLGLRRLARTDRVVSGMHIGAIESSFEAIAEALAIDLAREQFRFEPLERFTLNVGERTRTLYRASPLDQAVLFALAHEITKAVEPILSDHCFSYRRGYSDRRAQKYLVRLLHDHRQAHEVHERALYVVRTDVASYGESIRVDNKSPLFRQLVELFPEPRLRQLVESAIRQPIESAEAPPAPLAMGIPTGSPIQPPLCNLYLAPVDHELAALPGLGYARFGDDILMTHESPTEMIRALNILRESATNLGLELRSEKTRRWCWNGAGRPLQGRELGFVGTQTIEYLGARISFAGSILPTPAKRRAFLSSIRARLEAGCCATDGSSTFTERGKLACFLLKRAIDRRDPLADPAVETFLGTDVDRLARLAVIRDLELITAEVIVGRRGRRAFRQASPRSLRSWGFPRLDLPNGKVTG